MAYRNFINFSYLLDADWDGCDDTTFPLAQEGIDFLLDGLNVDDHTCLQVFGELFTEVIVVTKTSDTDLSITRNACPSDECVDECISFQEGDCVLDYKNYQTCDACDFTDIECDTCFESDDGSIIIEGDPCAGECINLEVNPDILPPDIREWLCELEEGELNVGDLILVITKDANDTCTYKVIDTEELCDKLKDCVGEGVDCPCDCPQGAQGPAGAEGPAGAQGPAGLQGPAGNDGVDGSDGADGGSGPPPVGGDCISIGPGVTINHDDAGPIDTTFPNGLSIDEKGHVVSQDPCFIPSRFSGNLDTRVTHKEVNLIATYPVNIGSPIQFTFLQPMCDSHYHISGSTYDGKPLDANIDVINRTPVGFQIQAPFDTSDITILVYP